MVLISKKRLCFFEVAGSFKRFFEKKKKVFLINWGVFFKMWILIKG